LPYVLFPLSGIISIVMEMENCAQIEVATVGNEGMVGVPLFLGAETTPGRAFSQVPGQSLRVPADVFKEEVQRRGKLEHMLQRYTQALFVQTAQSTACNRLHTIEQRGARWLLMTHDRVDGDQFPLTQEFLAQMLGVRRASVSEVAGEFQRAGLIAYARGNIAILDRQGLEDASCECYRVVRDEYERLLGGE
jgi:CRP-like cAMP-binding protein